MALRYEMVPVIRTVGSLPGRLRYADAKARGDEVIDQIHFLLRERIGGMISFNHPGGRLQGLAVFNMA